MLRRFFERQDYKGYSLFLIIHAVAVFLIGIYSGFSYWQAHQQEGPVTHDPAQNALAVHVGIGLVFSTMVLAIILYRRGRNMRKPFFSGPFTTRALYRVYDAVRCEPGYSFGNILRAVAVALLSIVWLVGFNYYRAGLQVFAGFVPSWVVNAWGGPSYLGAMAAHYVDIVLIFYATAGLLFFLTKSRRREHVFPAKGKMV